jgi:hypothetical protein
VNAAGSANVVGEESVAAVETVAGEIAVVGVTETIALRMSDPRDGSMNRMKSWLNPSGRKYRRPRRSRFHPAKPVSIRANNRPPSSNPQKAARQKLNNAAVVPKNAQPGNKIARNKIVQGAVGERLASEVREIVNAASVNEAAAGEANAAAGEIATASRVVAVPIEKSGHPCPSTSSIHSAKEKNAAIWPSPT